MLLELRRKYSSCILRPVAGVDDDIMDCFIDVACNKPEEGSKKNNNKYDDEPSSYTKSTLERKLALVLAKYDSLDSYFEPENNRMTELIIDLIFEMNADLQPVTENEMRSIRLFVDQSIVRAYKIFVCKKYKK